MLNFGRFGLFGAGAYLAWRNRHRFNEWFGSNRSSQDMMERGKENTSGGSSDVGRTNSMTDAFEND